jgi:adenosylhomocysteine nucleosidase
MTAVCATRTEARAARRAGLRAAVVGIGAQRELPEGPLVSFGLAGALHDGFVCGEVLDAARVVDEDGETLWEGGPLGVSGARRVTILAASAVVDEPAERLALHRSTGADAIDMESGVLARSGRLTGCVRAVSDTPSSPLGPLARVVDSDGSVAWGGVLRALTQPRRTVGALVGVRRALRNLAEASA